MIYGYTATEKNTVQEKVNAIQTYMSEREGDHASVIQDDKTNKVHWEKRELHGLLVTANPGDVVVVYEAADLARSTLQVIEVLNFVAKKGLVLCLVRYDQEFTPDKVYDTEKFLKLIRCIEGEFVAKRTTDALARRRAAGLPLGRPKGRKNKSRKLDRYREEIKRYLALNINKASIAKLVGCHAQTLYNYLEDTNLLAEVEAEQSSLKA